MLIGAVGISLGLFLFGPRIVRIVGEQITKMNPMRAFCVALAAALTVLVASQLGLPVSTTHIVVGAVFGVGFFREYYTTHSRRRRHYIRTHKRNQPQRRVLARRSGRAAPPQAGAPVAFHGHRGRLGHHRAVCRWAGRADILRRRLDSLASFE